MNEKLLFLAQLFIHHGFNNEHSLWQPFIDHNIMKSIIIHKKGHSDKDFVKRINLVEKEKYEMKYVNYHSEHYEKEEYIFTFLYYDG
jgi:hypothetical protein